MNNEVITIEEIFLKLINAISLIKKKIVFICLATIAFTVLLVFIRPPQNYNATTSFLLKGKDQAGGILNIASKFGISGNDVVTYDKILAVTKSDKILIELIKSELKAGDSNVLLGHNLIKEYGLKENWENKHQTFLDANLNDSTAVTDSIFTIIISHLFNNIEVVETNEGLIEIRTISSDANTSFTLNKRLIQLIEEYFHDFQLADQLITKRLVERKLDSVKTELIHTEDLHALLKNKSASAIRFEGFKEVQQNERQLGVLNQMFYELTTQNDLVNFRISEKTSSFKMLDTPRYPLPKTGNGLIFFIVLGLILGAILSTIYVIIANYLKTLMVKVKELQ